MLVPDYGMQYGPIIPLVCPRSAAHDMMASAVEADKGAT